MLPGLAWYQYQWIERTADLQRQGIDLQLHDALEGFARDFDREINGITGSPLLVQRSSMHGVPPPRLFQYWSSTPRLVSNVYCARMEDGEFRLLKMDPTKPSKPVEAVRWPPGWFTLEAELRSLVPTVPETAKQRWRIIAAVPALVRFLPVTPPSRSKEPGGGGWLILSINSEYLYKDLIPLLARRYFHIGEGGGYRIQVRGGSGNHAVLYDSSATEGDPEHTEKTISLASGAWQLGVIGERGSAEKSIKRSRVTGLIVSASSFLVLAAAFAALFLSTRRARDLARVHWDFVSSVSHELRTPLAALRSIGDNFCDERVGPHKIHRYGRLILLQVERLSEMVEDTLEFARSRQDNPIPPGECVNPAAAISDAIAAYDTTLEMQGIQIIKEIPAGLPLVRCPASLLRRSLQNLIGNAIKYGAAGQWIRITASSSGNEGVVISVEDRGRGVRPDEKTKIFEPFFRGRDARAAQISGVGLGLSIVKRSMESIGGAISLECARGCGARFSLRLPVATVYETTNFGG